MIYEKVLKKLLQTAKESKVITLKELNKECKLGLDLKKTKERNILIQVLMDLAKIESDNNRPLISSIVVKEFNFPRMPEKGFFEIAEVLFYYMGNKMEFFMKELKRTHYYWRNQNE